MKERPRMAHLKKEQCSSFPKQIGSKQAATEQCDQKKITKCL